MDLAVIAHLWAVYKAEIAENQAMVYATLANPMHTAGMTRTDKGAEIARRMAEAKGSDRPYDVARRLPRRGVSVSPQAIYRWFDSDDFALPSDENLAAFCAEYSVTEAWIRYGLETETARSALEVDSGRLVDELPAGIAEQTIEFIEFLIGRPEAKLSERSRAELASIIARIRADLARRRGRR